MRSHALSVVLALFIAAAAAAQQRPIFDPDDFIDPRERDHGPLFLTRLVLGGARSFIDDFRPTGEDVVFLHVTNSLYVRSFQFDYKRTEVRAENEPDVILCGCSSSETPIYFPTPPPGNATPNPPVPGAKDTFQFAGYVPKASSHGPPIMRRFRFSWSRQKIRTDVTSAATGEKSRLSGQEQSFGLDLDTHFPIRGRDVYGSLLLAQTKRTGTPEDRSQTELAYVSRFPALVWKQVLLRATVTVGGISNRGGTAINVVNPAFEAFWHDHVTSANVHVVFSPQTLNSSAGGWTTHHQIAVFVDRKLYLRLFNRGRTDDVRPE